MNREEIGYEAVAQFIENNKYLSDARIVKGIMNHHFPFEINIDFFIDLFYEVCEIIGLDRGNKVDAYDVLKLEIK